MMPHHMNMLPPQLQQFQQQQQQQQQTNVTAPGMMPQGANAQQNVNYTAAERSQRSVFVGNIPYEATEEELKDLFSQAGPVVGFRLVLDRETGKPKGYGFCEYLDQETAMSALRNLNGYEFHGRNLRVDTAAGDRSKEELRQLQMTFGGPQEESPFGPPVEPAKAPEAISRAVASLPPEQMFELMKQMKLCIQNNPNEARNMLLQNPQLAYALLQAQVVMRIVDPQIAMTLLHRDTGQAQGPIMPPGMTSVPGVGPPATTVAGALPQPPLMGMISVGPTHPSTTADMDYRSGFKQPAPVVPNFPSLYPTQQPTAQVPQQPPVRHPFMPGTSGMTGMVGGPARNAAPSAASAASSEEQEKAALIMQVLQLTDEQIAMLPVEQKQSVLILREQLRSSQR